MRNRCIFKVPAKINLHLQVGSKRTDGFHNISSIFQMVSLFDEMTVSSLKIDNDCRIAGNFTCNTENNLIYKAWQVYCSKAGKNFGVDFKVKKNIPSFAGLGGGSSNAAFALKALNNLFSCFTDEELFNLALLVGSDVPFFMPEKTAAIVKGRGENIKSINTPREISAVLVLPGKRISTASAYSWIDEEINRETDFVSEKKLMDIYEGNLKDFNCFKNDFSPVLEKRFAVFGKIKEQLNSLGACYSNITGSGSAVFGLFKDSNEAKRVVKEHKSDFFSIQKINLLERVYDAILE